MPVSRSWLSSSVSPTRAARIHRLSKACSLSRSISHGRSAPDTRKAWPVPESALFVSGSFHSRREHDPPPQTRPEREVSRPAPHPLRPVVRRRGLLHRPELESEPAGETAPLAPRRLAPPLPVSCAERGDGHPSGS